MDNMLVYTENGFEPIDTIQSGSMVLTHYNSYKPVEKVFTEINDDIFELNIVGSIPTLLSGNTKLLVRQASLKDDFVLNAPKWRKVNSLKEEDYVGLPINKKSTNLYRLTEFEVYRIGQYFSKGTPLMTAKEKSLCKGYKKGEIPPFIIELPENILKYFILGFVKDGNLKSIKFKSEKVAFQMVQILMKLHHRPYVITEDLRIEQLPEKAGHYEDNVIWQKAKTVKFIPNQKKKMYKLRIGPNQSFTINGFYVS